MMAIRVFSTYFDVDEDISPRAFVAWARQKDCFTLPAWLLEWHDGIKAKHTYSAQSNSRLQSELAQCRETIANLETSIANKDKTIAELQARLEQPAQDGGYASFFDAYPLCKEICHLHNEGKDRAEIVRQLTKSDNRLATNLMAGWITKPDTSLQSADAIKQAVKRLKNPDLK